MRRFFLLCCILSLLPSGARAAEAGTVKPEILSVDFYPTGARFVFQVQADKEFDLTLPGAFDPQSVRLLTQDNVTSVRVDTVSLAPTSPEELEPFKEVIAEKKRELRMWQGRKNALNQALWMLHATVSADLKDPELLAYIDRTREARLWFELEMVDMEIGMEKTSEELKKAERDMESLRVELQGKKPPNDDRAVKISGTATTSDPVLFAAYTPAAGWNVRYDMNLDSETGTVVAKMQARTWQQTGLPLEGEFSFHTRHPSLTIVPPELQPLRVSVGRRAGTSLADRLPGMPASGQVTRTSGTERGLEEDVAPIMNASLADVSVTGKGSLSGDGVPGDMLLGRFELTGSTMLISIPEQNREAWIVASLDPVTAPLLPGVAELAVDGANSGRTNIPSFGLQATLPFGMAPRLTSQKERLIAKSGSTWIGKGVFEDGYVLQVTSNMETEQEITVKDRLPVPVDEKIQLEVKTIEPAPAERDKDNKLTWKIKLKPKETKKIVVEYTLKYPGEEILEYR